MQEYDKLLCCFPDRIRKALFCFREKDGVCEIRLRRGLPLSLTTFAGNVLCDENGALCDLEHALRASDAEIRETLIRFAGGNLYRHLKTLRDGFLVNESGVRLGLCPDGMREGAALSDSVSGINLRLPRFVPGAADEMIRFFQKRGPVSTLLLSEPGAGKTTLLRDLALSLSRGATGEILRVAVIDERRELFPAKMKIRAGLIDGLGGFKKNEGIEIATRLFNPQVILCDEIGAGDGAEGLLQTCSTGICFFASAHARNLKSAMAKPHLKRLIEAGVFDATAVLERLPGAVFRSRLTVEAL